MLTSRIIIVVDTLEVIALLLQFMEKGKFIQVILKRI